MKKCYRVDEDRNILRTVKDGQMDWSHPRTHYWRKDRGKRGWKDEDDDIRCYWITAMKRDITGSWKRKHWLALCRTGFKTGTGPVVRQTAECMTSLIVTKTFYKQMNLTPQAPKWFINFCRQNWSSNNSLDYLLRLESGLQLNTIHTTSPPPQEFVKTLVMSKQHSLFCPFRKWNVTDRHVQSTIAGKFYKNSSLFFKSY